MVAHEGFAFPVEIEYEGLPDFCSRCKSIGHNVMSCRWLHPKQADKHEHPVDKGKKSVTSQKRYSQLRKPQDNPKDIG